MLGDVCGGRDPTLHTRCIINTMKKLKITQRLPENGFDAPAPRGLIELLTHDLTRAPGELRTWRSCSCDPPNTKQSLCRLGAGQAGPGRARPDHRTLPRPWAKIRAASHITASQTVPGRHPHLHLHLHPLTFTFTFTFTFTISSSRHSEHNIRL
ncbi:unnamed protein product [Pleuronectes platessa]|uniref:Uncharacterized protein n=1 Tax=Pleuronectes platessa TaxID=8262 RepID=A0A9N7VEV8_PLEPL|nr:unnamed protein product [Pleuronectes platessa]